MLDFGFYNMDCMQGMKEFPDNYFDLAIVDPPYGAGFTEGGGCKGWFTKYHQDAESRMVVERERESIPLRGYGEQQTVHGSVVGSTHTRHFTNGRRKKLKTYNQFREESKELSKKSYRGM